MATILRDPGAVQGAKLVALNAALGLISAAYGFDYALAANWRGFFYRCVTTGLLLILLGLLASVMRGEPAHPAKPVRRAWWRCFACSRAA